MGLPRMRTAEGILKELKAEDPNSDVKLHFIREIIKSGVLPVVPVGRKKLVDYEKFCDFLMNGGGACATENEHGKIRRVQE